MAADLAAAPIGAVATAIPRAPGLLQEFICFGFVAVPVFLQNSGRRDMIARGTSLLAAGLLLAGLAVAPALAEDAMNVTRSAEPQTIAGEGNKTLLVEGPFGIEWQSAGKIGVSVAPDKPGQAQGGGPAVMSGPGADGMAKGAMKLSGQQRYRVAIMASGPWEVTVSW